MSGVRMAFCGGLLSVSLPVFPPSKRAVCSFGHDRGCPGFFGVCPETIRVFFRAFFGGCMRRARTQVRAGGASGTPAGSCGQRGDQTKMHAGDMSCPGVFFNRVRVQVAHPRAAPVTIAPGLPEGHVGFRLRRRVAAHRAARPAAREPGKRHPAARPPAMPRNTLCAVFATGWRMLAACTEDPEHLAGSMFVDPEQRISGPAAERRLRRRPVILLWHGRPRAWPALPQWPRQPPRRPALSRHGGAGSRPRLAGGAAPRTGLRAGRRPLSAWL